MIATKCGERQFDPRAGLSRRYIIQQVEQRLRRLRTDHLDVHDAHFPDPDTPLEETLAVYDDLVRQGKIRSVGLSNHPAWQVVQALWIADDRRLVSAPVAAQVRANATVADVELAPELLDELTALAAETQAFHHRAGDGPTPPSSTA